MVGIPASMHDFGRVCIVCRMNHEKPHDGTAFECFHYGRTLAVLPLHGNRSSIVITAPMDQRELIMDMGEEQFNRDIEQRFESRLGSMSLVGERFAYPLVGVHARRFFANRFALIGDAAVGMHPVTAHGFNLGLSGASILAKEVISANKKGKDIGTIDVLNRYQTRHMRTTGPMYFGTNKIVKLFTDDRAPTKFIRQAALRVVNNFPQIKWAIQNKLTETRQSGRILPSFLRSR
jgi:ubiquinone biosynthesis UbiH/UbiF/VisC/COQ6 family hydroxylase